MSEPAAMAQDGRIGLELEKRYRIVRKLGDGGMGAVYEAEHLRIKRKVAVKMLHPHLAQKSEVVARFHREAEAAASIGHPNIIEVLDMGTAPDGAAFIVMEMLEGADLGHHLATQGPQPIAKIVQVFTQVCDALGAAHAAGIVHRDMKPENVFLTPRSTDSLFVKLLDFGISKVGGGGDHSLTATGTALGTPYYMSPEQCQGAKDLDARTDIYALGVMLFQALTGAHPFEDDNYPMLVLKICTQAPPSLAMARPDLPPQLIALVEGMLRKDRNNRPPDCGVVKAALEALRDVKEDPSVTSALQKSGTRPRAEAWQTAPLSLAEAGAALDAVQSGRAPSPSYNGAAGSYEGTRASYEGSLASYLGAPASHPGGPASHPGAPASYPGGPASHAGGPGSHPGAPGSYPGAPGSIAGALGSTPSVPAARATASSGETSPVLLIGGGLALLLLLGGGIGTFLALAGGDAGETTATRREATGGDTPPSARPPSPGSEAPTAPSPAPTGQATARGVPTEAAPDTATNVATMEAARVEAARVEAARVEPARVEATQVEAAQVAQVEAAQVQAAPVAPADESAAPGGEAADPATLRVVAIPFGDIFVDGRRVGQNDVSRRLPPGSHQIRVQRGTSSASRRVTLAPGQRETVTLRTR